jgi:isoquinoline 1-oxidoreductase alpha subunit
VKYKLKVNGQTRTLEAPEDMPLLWALRDGLDLKGTKFGCGIAQCGACTVLIDGEARRSCITPVSSVGTSSITTIEGSRRTGATRSSARGRRSTSPSAATARPGRSCPPPRCWRRRRTPPTRHRRGDGGQHLPLRDLPPDPARDPRAAELGKTTASAATGSGK